MRRTQPFLLVLLPVLVAAGGAAAQSWPNDVNPRGDAINAAVAPLERMLDAAPRPTVARPGLPVAERAAPIPILDWTPPPAAAPAAAPRRPARRVARRAAPRAAAPPRQDNAWLEQRLATREGQMETLRQQIEQDRRTLQAQRASATPGQPAPQPSTGQSVIGQQPSAQPPGGADAPASARPASAPVSAPAAVPAGGAVPPGNGR
ncbi:hypothetical protein [Roseomonas elaeocarpi]|uniref:Uncharacterized protein n=1 Tax=Roseomonas elaeocarpi TaxID=907779 RepID=A0ABV6K0F6_9PROT